MADTKKLQLMAPVSGLAMAITDVSDPVFSQKMMGDGFGIDPTDGQIAAPVDGRIMMIADTNMRLASKPITAQNYWFIWESTQSS